MATRGLGPETLHDGVASEVGSIDGVTGFIVITALYRDVGQARRSVWTSDPAVLPPEIKHVAIWMAALP